MEQIFAPGLFADEVVVVTGGGSGIGRCVAEEVGRLGAKVAICGRTQEKLDKGVEHLEAAGVTVLAKTCDTRKPELVGEFVDAVMERFGRIDALVNNAGGQFPTTAETLQLKGFEAVVRNNLFGTFNMTQAIAKKAFFKQKSGRVVNVTAQIKRGFPGMMHTGAARAGVENMTKSIAVEWINRGVRINCVAPGTIRTSGTKQYPPVLLEMSRKSIPMRRLGTAEETAHLIVYLASKAASYVTGQTWYIDGGASLHGDSFHIPDEVPGGEPPAV